MVKDVSPVYDAVVKSLWQIMSHASYLRLKL
jgi:hypothetical protein